ncbi:MAG: DNA-binding NarL/FixJ family response regulator [Chitinophagales bacterium]|jgi:DNA-binding NarL/FixJ family response regulator
MYCHAADGEKFLNKINSTISLDLVLMDIEMPVLNGIDTTHKLKLTYPTIKDIMLTVFFDNDENIFNAIRAGADGYLLKEVKPDTLYKGIFETLAVGAAMNPSIAVKTLKLLRNPVDFDLEKDKNEVVLSAREIEVLEQLSQGLNYTKIAENIFL